MIRALGDRMLSRPAEGVLLLCLAQVVLWGGLPALTASAPMLDAAEMLAWGEHWQLGYYKHPPLPAWLAEIARRVTGEPVFAPMLMSQLCVALTFLFVYLLGRRLLGARDALLGTALGTGVYYFSWPTPELNHNVVQMPIWAASFWAFAWIRDTPRRVLPWLALGLAAGVGVYAKYSVAVLYLVLGLWLLAEARLRAALLSPAPWLGALVAVVVALPHLAWLVRSDFLPLAYAGARSAGAVSPWRPIGFLAAQLADHAPMLLPLALALLPWRRETAPKPPAAGVSARGDARCFLAVATLAPVLLTAALAAVTGAGLKDMWGAPMFTTSGLFAVAILRGRLDAARARRLLAGCAVLMLALPVAFALQVPAAQVFSLKPPRHGWPMAEIAGAVTRTWHAATDAPLVHVGGDAWLAGLVAAGSRARPILVHEADPAYSPWVAPADLMRDGLVVVSFADRPAAPLAGRTPALERDTIIAWSRPEPLTLRIAVYPPAR